MTCKINLFPFSFLLVFLFGGVGLFANGQQVSPTTVVRPAPAQRQGQLAPSVPGSSVVEKTLDVGLPTTLHHQILGHAKRPIVSHAAFTGFWRTDGGFVAKIRIKNALVTKPLEVAPVLYMADGTEYRLAPVVVPTAGVVSVNINQALAQAPPSVMTHISSFGSASLIYRHESAGHLIASLSMQDTSRSLVLSNPFTESRVSQIPASSAPNIWEGAWWKHDADVQGFLAVSNATDHEAQVKIQLIGTNGTLAGHKVVSLRAHSTQMLSLENAQGGLGAEGDAGGIRVEHSGEPGAIAVAGGLLNAKEGYSANIPFAQVMGSPAGPVTLGSAGIMVGKPDAMMRFPAETMFTPYLVLRNTSTKSLPVVLQISYMTQSAPVSKQVSESLPARATKRVNLPNLLRTLGMNDLSGSINIGASYTGLPSDLVMASGSVDQSGNYVFEVQPQLLSSTHKKLGNYWDLDAGSNTMYSLWNPTDKAQDVMVSLYYDNGKGRYKIPVHAAAQSSVMLDLKNIIEANAPDADGNVFPSKTSEGSATIESADGPTGQMNLIISGAVFNVVTGTCWGCCVPCCGTSDVFLDPSSDSCSVGDSEQFQATVEECDGTTFQVTGGQWSSSNLAVMTVNDNGLMSAVGAGSAILSFKANFPASADCAQPPGNCPPTDFQTSGPVTAAPTFTGVLTANDNFSGRSTTNFGIAEVINLSFSTNPSGTPATSFGGLQWTIVSGGGTLSNAGTAGTATYTAPSAPATVTLRLADGQSNFHNYTIAVIAPSGAHMVKNSNLRHTNGLAGVGFLGDVFLEPANVSFAGIFFSEGLTFATATGYYRSLNGLQHSDGPLTSVGACKSNTGCKINGQDRVDSGDGTPAFSVGDFLWPIPWQYSVGTGSQTQFMIANQHFLIDATGRVSIEKAGSGLLSTNASDPTSSY